MPHLAPLLLAAALVTASDYDEFKIKREPVFDFARKPTLTRNGDRVTIFLRTGRGCH